MFMVSAGNVFANLDCLIAVNKRLLMLSVYNRSGMAVTGVCANVGLNEESVRIMQDGKIVAVYTGKMETTNYNTKIQNGRENIAHGVCLSKLINTKYIFVQNNSFQEDMYSFFMNTFEFPILREWIPYLAETALHKKLLVKVEVEVIGEMEDDFSYTVIQNEMTNEDLQVIISQGLNEKNIKIADSDQEPLDFVDMDNYFQKYGHTLVENLEKQLSPLSPIKEKVDELCFINKRLYPGQSAIVNGAVQCLNYKKHTYLVESMGAGKVRCRSAVKKCA